MAIFRRGPRNGGVECKGVWKNHDFRPISHFISELMQDRAITIILYYARRPEAAPRILRWGYKTGFASEASEKNFGTPHFSKCGGTSNKQANISRGLLLNILICCLVVALINIGRPRPMVLWIRERDSLVMARLVSWLNLAAICHTKIIFFDTTWNLYLN